MRTQLRYIMFSTCSPHYPIRHRSFTPVFTSNVFSYCPHNKTFPQLSSPLGHFSQLSSTLGHLHNSVLTTRNYNAFTSVLTTRTISQLSSPLGLFTTVLTARTFSQLSSPLGHFHKCPHRQDIFTTVLTTRTFFYNCPHR